MEKEIQTQASSVDKAIELALEQLGVDRDAVEVEVLSKGGLFSKAKVKVTVKETAEDQLEKFVNGTLERMGAACRATVVNRDGELYVNIEGEDSNVAIGYRGEVLDALQCLTVTFLNDRNKDYKKVVVDAENYRERRRVTLTELAERLAQKAVRLRRKIALEPMHPFERRIIHSALAEDVTVETHSEGEEPNRYIVITPVGVELKDPRPLKNGEHDRRDGRKDSRGRKSSGGRNDRGRSKNRNERRDFAREREEEVEDGNVYRGMFTQDDFVKPAPPAGPPKYKSFGGKKRF